MQNIKAYATLAVNEYATVPLYLAPVQTLHWCFKKCECVLRMRSAVAYIWLPWIGDASAWSYTVCLCSFIPTCFNAAVKSVKL